jgi:hypothetical protein
MAEIEERVAARRLSGAVPTGPGFPAPEAGRPTRSPAPADKAETQEPGMSQANPLAVEMNDKAREEMMQKIKELEEEIAEMKKGLTPLDPD